MTIKVYISGICGSHEVRKQQQRVLFILQSLPIDLQIVDVTEPGRDEDLNFMQEVAKKHEKKTQLPPQIFNESDYCGDYADFELANDDDEIMRFLKLEDASKAETVNNSEPSGDLITQNGIHDHKEPDTVEVNGHSDINEMTSATQDNDMHLVDTEMKADEIKNTDTSPVVEEAEIIQDSTETSQDPDVSASKDAEKTKESSAEEESEEESE